MTIKLEIIGENSHEVFEELKQLCEKFGLDVLAAPTVEQVTPTAVTLTTIVDETSKPKRTRKQKAAIDALAGDDAAIDVEESEEPAPETATAMTPEQLADLKERAIAALADLYTKPGGAQRVADILKAHGGAAKKFTEIAAEKFPAIAVDIGLK